MAAGPSAGSDEAGFAAPYRRAGETSLALAGSQTFLTVGALEALFVQQEEPLEVVGEGAVEDGAFGVPCAVRLGTGRRSGRPGWDHVRTTRGVRV